MPVKFDVIIDVNSSLLPLGEFIGLVRKIFQRRALVLLIDGFTVTRQLLERLAIQLKQEFSDRLVEFPETEKFPIAQGRQDPTLDDNNSGPGLRAYYLTGLKIRQV